MRWRASAPAPRTTNDGKLLPSPAGLDEARARWPQRFGLAPAPSGSGMKTDDGQEYWADQARGSLPAPIGELAALAIEYCKRTKKTEKLLPGAVARRKLEEIGQSAEWAALRPSDRSMVLTLLSDGAEVFPGVVRAALGTPERLPAPLADEGATEPASFADVPSVHIAPIVAAQLLYGGKLGLMHGPAGGGKTTVLANVVARITLGAEWLGRPTIKGTVLVVTEDRDTWKDALETAGADQTMVHPVQWRDLARKVADAQPVAVVIDTMQYVASIVGSGELDSAREVDIILRPLERLCRDNGVAVIVTDHEPWADGSGPTDASSGTKKWPRHSGAKVATCDYILRCSVDNDITTIERGSKVRRGIAVDRIVTVNLHGDPVAAPPSGTANGAGQSNASTELTILYDDDREIVVPAAAQWLRPLLAPGEALTFTELETRAGCKAARTRKARKLLVEAGIWRITGTGKRGDPMRVEVAVSDSRPGPEPPPDAGTRIRRDARPPLWTLIGREWDARPDARPTL